MNQAKETADGKVNSEATGENNHEKFREAAELHLDASVKSCVQLRRDVGLGYKTAGSEQREKMCSEDKL